MREFTHLRSQPAYRYIHKDCGGNGLFYAWATVMHTRLDMALVCPESVGVQVSDDVLETIGLLEAIGDKFNPGSELAMLNRVAADHPVVISEELFNIIGQCVMYAGSTFGLFDISIDSCCHSSGTIGMIHLDNAVRSVFFERKGISLNLSGFLKGYALDRIRPVLDASDITDALINFGNSSILALGDRPGGSGWKVGFGQADKAPVILRDECLTTSGNSKEENDHLVNPLDGTLVKKMGTLSVMTGSGALGEVLSTSLFVCDIKRWPELLSSFGDAAVIVAGPGSLGRAFRASL